MNPLSIENLNDFVFLDDPNIAPDGARVVFCHQSVNRAGNGYTRTLWLASLDGAEVARPYTTGGKDSAPRWSPDGARLGFLSGRGGAPGVFVLPANGGEAHPAASHRNGIAGFDWSPDGSRIAFVAGVHAGERAEEDTPPAAGAPSPPFKDEWQSKRDKEQRDRDEQLRLDPRVVKAFPYRSGTAFFDDRYKHVYAVDVPAGFAEKSDAKPRRLTDGEVNFDSARWMPDGSAVASFVTRDPEAGNLTRLRDAVIIPLDGPRSYRRLAREGYSVFDAKPSPDGKWIAVATAADHDPGYGLISIVLLSVETGDAVDLTRGLDRSADKVKWDKSGEHVYFTLETDGRVTLWRARAADRAVEALTDDDHDVTAFDVDAAGRVVFVAATPEDPSALFVREPDGATRPLFQPNAKFLAGKDIGRVESLRYDSDGRQIQAWIVTPPGFDPAKRYPLIVQIHGGPHVQWSASFPSMWHELRAMAARGYVVFYCNPRGSEGYGEAFAIANRGDWGDGPMRDVLRGVEAVAARGFIDTARMAVTGGSYGGYLTVWIIAHDGRFAAACSQRGVYNLISMRGTNDIPHFIDREIAATPWEDVGKLWAMSPLAHAPRIGTPLLIEHSEQDFRVPIEQAEQMFTTLRLLRKPVEFVRWPREGHEISRAGEPRHREERIRRIVEWFDRYCRPADGDPPPAGEGAT